MYLSQEFIILSLVTVGLAGLWMFWRLRANGKRELQVETVRSIKKDL